MELSVNSRKLCETFPDYERPDDLWSHLVNTYRLNFTKTCWQWHVTFCSAQLRESFLLHKCFMHLQWSIIRLWVTCILSIFCSKFQQCPFSGELSVQSNDPVGLFLISCIHESQCSNECLWPTFTLILSLFVIHCIQDKTIALSQCIAFYFIIYLFELDALRQLCQQTNMPC